MPAAIVVLKCMSTVREAQSRSSSLIGDGFALYSQVKRTVERSEGLQGNRTE